MPGKRGGVTLKELQAKAKAAKIKGWSKMRKAELMQRVGGGGGSGSRAATPTKKRPVTTAKRYEATKVAGAIADKLVKKTGVSDPAEKDAMQHRLLTSVKKAVTQARKTPGATDQDVRKAAAQAVKAEVMAIRGAAGKKQLKSAKADAVEPKKKRSTRSKSKPATPVNDEAKRRAEIEAKNRARTEALRAKHGSDALARAQGYRDKGVGDKEKYQAGRRLVSSAASRQNNPRIDGAITRSELERTQKALDRRARKTGKEVTVTRNLDYNPGEGKREIHKATLTGSAEKGGRESRRPPKREKASGSQGFDDLAGAFGSSPTSKQKSSKTTVGTPQKQKSSSSTRKSPTTSTPQKQKRSRSTAATSRKKK